MDFPAGVAVGYAAALPWPKVISRCEIDHSNDARYLLLSCRIRWARPYEPRLNTLEYPICCKTRLPIPLRTPPPQWSRSTVSLSGTSPEIRWQSSSSGMLMAGGRWRELNSRAVRTSMTFAPCFKNSRAIPGRTKAKCFQPNNTAAPPKPIKIQSQFISMEPATPLVACFFFPPAKTRPSRCQSECRTSPSRKFP